MEKHKKKFQKCINNFLDIIAPLSPKTIELNSRLANEIIITQDMKKHGSNHNKQIADIKDEIELKYNTFDANQLLSFDENVNKSKCFKYQWESGIKMLSFMNSKDSRIFVYHSGYEDFDYEELSTTCCEIIDNLLTENRCKESLSNLECITLEHVHNGFE